MRTPNLLHMNPHILFLIDSLGAALSIAIALLVAKFEPVFSIPPPILYTLSCIAGVFFIYSFFCFYRKATPWQLYLKRIAIANLLYCGLIFGLIIYLYQKLALLGLLYFGLEIIVIAALAIFELKTAAGANRG